MTLQRCVASVWRCSPGGRSRKCKERSKGYGCKEQSWSCCYFLDLLMCFAYKVIGTKQLFLVSFSSASQSYILQHSHLHKGLLSALSFNSWRTVYLPHLESLPLVENKNPGLHPWLLPQSLPRCLVTGRQLLLLLFCLILWEMLGCRALRVHLFYGTVGWEQGRGCPWSRVWTHLCLGCLSWHSSIRGCQKAEHWTSKGDLSPSSSWVLLFPFLPLNTKSIPPAPLNAFGVCIALSICVFFLRFI